MFSTQGIDSTLTMFQLSSLVWIHGFIAGRPHHSLCLRLLASKLLSLSLITCAIMHPYYPTQLQYFSFKINIVVIITIIIDVVEGYLASFFITTARVAG